MLKIGSHVSMSGKDMFLNSVKEAAGYGANTFMLYTGAPQNTRRKPIEELNIEAGWEAMHHYGMDSFVVHAPYIINLANTVKPETFELAVNFLTLEVQRTAAMKSKILILHPGAHVGAGVEAGTAQIIRGLNEVWMHPQIQTAASRWKPWPERDRKSAAVLKNWLLSTTASHTRNGYGSALTPVTPMMPVMISYTILILS